MLGISTAWKSREIRDGSLLIKEILDLELDGLELEYRITETMLHDIRPYLSPENTRVFSIHNFFPVPNIVPQEKGNGDLFLLSSQNSNERTQAIKYTINTIQHAVDLGAKVVVLHLGRVSIDTIKTRLFEFYDEKMIGSKPFVAFMREAKSLRAQAKDKTFDFLLKSLEKVVREAERYDIYLGIENRYYFREYPDFDEIGYIFEKFKGANFGYWHDVGHAKVNENLGLINANLYLEAYGEKLLGVHLHDVKGYKDHFEPGSGSFDFEGIKKYLKPETLKIIEVHPKVTKEDLLNGIKFLKSIGIS